MKYNIALPFLLAAGVGAQYVLATLMLVPVKTETSVVALEAPKATGVTIPFLPPGEGTTSKRELQAENAAAREGTAMIILHTAAKQKQHTKKKKKPVVVIEKAPQISVPMPIMTGMNVAITQKEPEKFPDLNEEETPRPTTTFCRKIGNPKVSFPRKEICFERDDILRKIVRTYEKTE
jgi:hypothetical protein